MLPCVPCLSLQNSKAALEGILVVDEIGDKIPGDVINAFYLIMFKSYQKMHKDST